MNANVLKDINTLLDKRGSKSENHDEHELKYKNYHGNDSEYETSTPSGKCKK